MKNKNETLVHLTYKLPLQVRGEIADVLEVDLSPGEYVAPVGQVVHYGRHAVPAVCATCGVVSEKHYIYIYI